MKTTVVIENKRKNTMTYKKPSTQKKAPLQHRDPIVQNSTHGIVTKDL